MGCDIHTYAERKTDNGFVAIDGLSPFSWRSYGIFGFLAGVRNYSDVTPISAPRGFPDDASVAAREEYKAWDGDAHTPAWLTVEELNAFDYDQETEDRRVIRNGDGGCTCAPGGGEAMTYRKFLGEGFFDDLDALNAGGASRVVFWFDS